MDLSAIGEAVLIPREGRRLKAYRDSVGVWTIGIGHTSAAGAPLVTSGLTITSAQCDAIFERDIAKYVAAGRLGLEVAVSQNAFDALVSNCYNIGPGAFAGSTFLRRINAGDMAGAYDAILMWKKPAAILTRRQAEAQAVRHRLRLRDAARDDRAEARRRGGPHHRRADADGGDARHRPHRADHHRAAEPADAVLPLDR
ncbi:lysozyme [Methylobacterium sp. J-090]|uniref:lysozyme n=1 Tax=Methylobacterium sp. J-090 TaxID=2836666 RepID=UPI001FBBF724|nr:lysozyme [Methylobacterium sp. J-090]MCJ2080957.1 lysozyme [Methylobacterium sp. J-090]